MVKTRFLHSIASGLLLLPLLFSRQIAAQEVGGCCGRQFTVTGDLHHFKPPATVVVESAEKPEIYAEEVFGQSITAIVPGLPPGNYRVTMDFTEAFQHGAGERLMDIAIDGRRVIENLDIFQASGGFAKPYRLTAQIERTTDDAQGPLTVVFTAKKDQAKFNAITILDAGYQVVASVQAKDLVDLADANAARLPDIKEPPIYRDPDQPLEKRVDDLIRRMSLKEKVSQMQNNAAAIERLGIPFYDYWNEALHGVARAGVATVFPQAIGMAATWDAPLIQQEGDTIATEARAKYHEAMRQGLHAQYYGLTFWSPNINIFRDPRWGRGQETYGEDPFLTARLGVAFINGLQGDDPRYFKTLACAKHYAVHSGPEPLRHEFDVSPPTQDLYDTYLPQFEAAVREAHVGAVMGAYNRVFGVPACASPLLLTDLLRKQWGFQGHVVSDCGAIADIFEHHHYARTAAEAAALGVKAGCDLECGSTASALVRAVNEKLLTEADIDQALRRTLGSRFRLGMFDPPERVPFAQIPMSENDSPAHRALALKAARESIVLLKNTGVLPLDRARLKRLLVVGANADATAMLRGNYYGTPAQPVNILQGIRAAAGPDVSVVFAAGGPLVPGMYPPVDYDDQQEPLNLARDADAIVYVGGISADIEGEEKGTSLAGFKGGDRTRIELPAIQTQMLQKLQGTGKPVVFVNCSGGAVAMPWEAEHLPAIVQVWYPGQAGGTAVADVLFGHYNPAGRLPVTFYRATADLPAFEDYSMANRTYRYFTGKPLFAFGHGLSYTKFEYKDLQLAAKSVPADGTLKLSVNVANVGAQDGDEVVQVYARNVNADHPVERATLRQLAAFKRQAIPAHTAATVTLEVPLRELRRWNPERNAYEVETGDYEIEVGASSADIRQRARLQVNPPAIKNGSGPT